MAKGEIALFEQFLLFPHCFKRLVLQTRKNQGLCGKGLRRGAVSERWSLKAGCLLIMVVSNAGLTVDEFLPYENFLQVSGPVYLLISDKIDFNSFHNDKILDWSKLKAYADDKLDVAKIMVPVFDSVENIVGKGENADYQHFLLFPRCFQKASFSRV